VQGLVEGDDDHVGARREVAQRHGGTLFRRGLVFEAHSRLYHSTLDLRVIKKKKKVRCAVAQRHVDTLPTHFSIYWKPGTHPGSSQRCLTGFRREKSLSGTGIPCRPQDQLQRVWDFEVGMFSVCMLRQLMRASGPRCPQHRAG